MSDQNVQNGLTAWPSGPLRGEARVPGDKSISHRALILGALSVGETVISGLLESGDVLHTGRAMRAFGAAVDRGRDGRWHVHGVGTGGFAEPDDVIDCGNSGTGVRLIMGAAATQPITATYTGDRSLRSRPMARVTEPLARFGAHAVGRAGGRLPLTLVGANDPLPIAFESPHPSAQVKSAVLLAGLSAPGRTHVIEAVATRDHTERMFRGFGAEVTTSEKADGREITVVGQPELTGQAITVPRDPSSAAFPVCAALITEGSDIVVPGVSRNPTRTGLYETLLDMGADLTFSRERVTGGEPVADLRVRSSRLSGVDVPPDRAPSMIDEYPILAVVAAFAEGRTTFRGIGELRVKESDRIDATARGLEANGVTVEEGRDWLVVDGRGGDGVPGGGTVAARLDHRIAMAFLCLGLASRAPVSVDDARVIDTSFPGFAALMSQLGARLAGNYDGTGAAGDRTGLANAR